MASTPSTDELMATIAALRAEIARLQWESVEFYNRFALANSELVMALDMIHNLQKRIKELVEHMPPGVMPAPTPFSDPRTVPGADSDGAAAAGGGSPRWTYGSFYPDEDADGGAAAAGGGPPVPRTKTSNGPPQYRGLPALGPSDSGYGPCTGGETDGIPAITRRDEEGNLHVVLCATPSGYDYTVEAVAPGQARWVPRRP